MAVRFSVFHVNGSLAGSEEMTLRMHIGAGSCPARAAVRVPPDVGSVHLMSVGFDGASAGQGNTGVVLDSVEGWLKSLGVAAQRTHRQAAISLGIHDVLLLVLNANAPTAPHAMELLLRQREQAGGGAGRVGVVHVDDIEEAAGKHFYGRLDFVLATYCRHAQQRQTCVPVGMGGELMPLPSAHDPGAVQQAWVSMPEYVWAFVGTCKLTRPQCFAPNRRSNILCAECIDTRSAEALAASAHRPQALGASCESF